MTSADALRARREGRTADAERIEIGLVTFPVVLDGVAGTLVLDDDALAYLFDEYGEVFDPFDLAGKLSVAGKRQMDRAIECAIERAAEDRYDDEADFRFAEALR